jgi:hypothetical protein
VATVAVALRYRHVRSVIDTCGAYRPASERLKVMYSWSRTTGVSHVMVLKVT